jgi:hypothetical protein
MIKFLPVLYFGYQDLSVLREITMDNFTAAAKAAYDRYNQGMLFPTTDWDKARPETRSFWINIIKVAVSETGDDGAEERQRQEQERQEDWTIGPEGERFTSGAFANISGSVARTIHEERYRLAGEIARKIVAELAACQHMRPIRKEDLVAAFRHVDFVGYLDGILHPPHPEDMANTLLRLLTDTVLNEEAE